MGSPYGGGYRAERERVIAGSTFCALCGGPLYPHLKFPHPMSTTTDHVREVMDGGDWRNNLRAAHLRCNSSRGARNGNRRRGQTRTTKRRSSRDW